MWLYLLSHWRGEQDLVRTCLINPTVVFVTVVVFFLPRWASVVIARISHSMRGQGWADQLADLRWVYLPLGLSMLAVVWACVGIVSCGARYAFGNEGMAGGGVDVAVRRGTGFVIIVWGLAVLVFSERAIGLATKAGKLVTAPVGHG